MKWIFKIFIIFVFCGFYVRYKQEFKKTILDKHLQFRLVRVNIEVNLILTCRSCSKLRSTGLGRDTSPMNYVRIYYIRWVVYKFLKQPIQGVHYFLLYLNAHPWVKKKKVQSIKEPSKMNVIMWKNYVMRSNKSSKVSLCSIYMKVNGWIRMNFPAYCVLRFPFLFNFYACYSTFRDKVYYCSQDHIHFIKKILKMGHMTLFTYLKIISL